MFVNNTQLHWQQALFALLRLAMHRGRLLPCALALSLAGPALPAQVALEKPLSRADARHLLIRTGFGVRADRLAAFTGISRQEAIDRIVAGLGQPSGVPMPDWVHAPAPRFFVRGDLDDEERRAFDAARDRELVELRLWWLRAMLFSPSPQTERLMLFWHDHFATSYHGINRQTIALARQQQTLRRLGTRSFRDLLKAMIRDPALLNFLDAPSNRKTAPNENLGRELLELFTLGEGEYDESTVKMAARALTGHTVNHLRNLEFRINWGQRDTGEKTLFGQTGTFNGDALIDIILEQPAAARYLATRFWHAYIADHSPDARTINTFATVLRQSDYDIATLYRAMLESSAFWAPENRAALVKSPVHLLIGLARSLEYPACHWRELPSLLAELGMDLFAPPDVSGWQEGAAFVTAGKLLNRYRAVQALLAECGDTVSPPLSSIAGAPALRVGAAHVRGASEHPETGQQTLALALENLRTPHANIYTLLFRLHEADTGGIDMRITSVDCWPGCLQRWPSCAWQSKVEAKRRTVVFPLARAAGDIPARIRCQYDQLNEPDKRLVDSLWTAMPEVLDGIRRGNRAARFAEQLDYWQMRLAAHRAVVRGGVYAARAYPLEFESPATAPDGGWATPSVAVPGTAGAPMTMTESMAAMTESSMAVPDAMAASMDGTAGVTPASEQAADDMAEPRSPRAGSDVPGASIDPVDLLLPGIDAASLADPASLPVNPAVRRQWLIEHPAFQVY